jgi:hypothetical protein
MTNSIKTYQLRIFTDLNDLDPDNSNVDTEILLESGERYSDAFFTLKNIEFLMKGFQISGECKNGLYFWASDMIVVQKITEATIRETIEHLLKTGEYASVLSNLPNE